MSHDGTMKFKKASILVEYIKPRFSDNEAFYHLYYI